jgi:hypothetical protein
MFYFQRFKSIWSPKAARRVLYSVHKNPAVVLILTSSIQSMSPHSSSLRGILVSFLLSLCLPNGLFLFGFPARLINNSSYLYSCYLPARLILIDFIILVPFAKNTSYEASHRAFQFSLIQTFSSAPCSCTCLSSILFI